MRMTNKIMQNNSLYNINNNKVLQDKLSTQMSTQKKITRPSDDPVVAIRALRLRTSVSELTQYYEKNAPDAESWLTVTEKALGTGTEVLTDMVKQANKAANKDLGVEELTIITQQMRMLRDEYYSTGNVDYAGRFVFTGYRTDTSLSFTSEVEDASVKYDYTSITEPVKIGDFDTVNYTNMSAVDGLNKSNYTDTKYDDVTEQKITNSNIHRIRLSYDDLKGGTPTIKYKDKDGNDASITNITVATSAEAAYKQIAADEVIFVPETGEVLFGDEAYKNLNDTVTTDTEISITYGKDSWKNGDLRPEHYFTCEATVTKNGQTENKVFNKDADVDSQIIEYDVGYNQKIRVNTLASELFTPALRRDMDDLISAIGDVDTMEKNISTLKDMLKKDPDNAELQERLDAANKSYTLMNDKMQKLFESSMTKAQGHLDLANSALTATGNRGSRVELVSNRLAKQQTNFKTLSSENEDVDITEVTVNLRSVELAYNASLMATGKIAQTTLLNYL